MKKVKVWLRSAWEAFLRWMRTSRFFFEKWPFGEKLEHELLEAHLVTAGASLVLGDNGDMQCPHNWLNWGSWLESEIVASWQYFVTDLKTQQYIWSLLLWSVWQESHIKTNTIALQLKLLTDRWRKRQLKVSLNGRRLRSPTRPHPAAATNGETGFLR